MIIIMKDGASSSDLKAVKERVENNLPEIHLKEIVGEEKTIIAAVGNARAVRELGLESMDGVDRLVPIADSFKLAAKMTNHDQRSSFRVKNAQFGANAFNLILGPCTVESEETALRAALLAAEAGADAIRAGVFKPRTSPFAFQGPGEAGYPVLEKIKAETGLPIVSELTSPENAEGLAEVADIIQIGARNMQNYHLLKVVGSLKRPVLLKRGLSATLEEFLQAADYILSEGEERVILCERGIRTFDTAARFTLDLGSIPILKEKTHLPIIVDPSHAAGRRALVLPYAKAATAIGADGLIVETTVNPSEARCDANQQLDAEDISDFVTKIRRLADLIN